MLMFITQREETNQYGNAIDSLEHSYVKYFKEKGFDDIIVLPNNLEVVETLLFWEPEAIVLTGGGDVGKQPNRDLVEKRLIEYSLKTATPLLGICRGMQFINSYFGGSLEKDTLHSNEREHEINLVDDSIVKYVGETQGQVNSFHNFMVTNQTVAKNVKVFALSSHGNIEGIVLPENNIIGIQWHPERSKGLSDWIDKSIIKNMKEVVA